MTFYTWSTTPAANGTIDATIGMAEGMAPSAVNDGVRAVMAAAAKYRDDQGGGLKTGGNATTYTVTTSQNFDTLAHLSGKKLKLLFHTANGASPTLNVDTLGSVALQVSSGTAVGAGVIGGNSIWDVTYNSAVPAFLLSGVPAAIQAGTVNSTAIAAGAVTYAKIQNVTDQRLLGNFSGGAAAPSELALIGPAVTSTTLTFPTAPAGTAKNFAVNVLTNTTVQVRADEIVLSDGSTSYQTIKNLNATIDLGTAGAINRLDTGTIAIDSWYYIYPAAKADGTAGALASLNSTSPLLPSGYTYYCRPPGAAVQTIHGSATLYGTKQAGNRAQYVVGLAQTASAVQVASGSAGSIGPTPTWVSIPLTRYVPPTATRVDISAMAIGSGFTALAIAAPNSSYAGYVSSVNAPPVTLFAINGTSANTPAEFILETANIYWAGTASSYVYVTGWSE